MGRLTARTPMVAALALGLFVAGCNCGEKAKFNSLGPVFSVVLFEEGTAPGEGTTLADDAKIDFGVVKVGQTVRKHIALKNSGSSGMHLEAPALDKGVDFKLVDPLKSCADRSGDTADVPIGDCDTVTIEYTPSGIAAHDDVLTLKSDDTNRTEVKLYLSGRGSTGMLQVCVSSVVGSDKLAPVLDKCSSNDVKDLYIDYGPVPMGAGDVKRRVRITNLGELPLDITSIKPDAKDPVDFAVDPADFKGQIARQESVEINLVFKPTDIGERKGTVTVDADDPAGAPVKIHLVSKGDAAKLCLDPSTLDFGNVPVNTSAKKDVKLVNCGTKNVQITNLSLEGDSMFTVATAPSSAPLQPNQSALVTIQFAPTSLGPKNGKLRVASTDQVSPISFAQLKGNGYAAPECKFEASSTTVDFGAVVQGNKVTKTITFHNAGGVDCVVKSFKIDSAGQAMKFLVDSQPLTPATVPANGLIDVRVAYIPQNTNGPHTGVMSVDVTDPAYDSMKGQPPMAINLKGIPTARPECRLDIVPANAGGFTGRTMQFGSVGTGDKKKLLMTMKNIGGIDCNIATPAFALLTDTAVFSFGTQNPKLPTKIAPGQQEELEVVFQPNKESTWYSYSNSFNIQTDDNQPSECGNSTPGCKKVSLQGSGVRMAIDIVPNNLDFGVVTVGCNSADKTITIYNVGGAAVTLNKIYVDPATAPFTVTKKPTLPYNLGPGGSVDVSVRFRPSQATSETALLTIEHNFSNGVNTVQLKGSGTTDKHQIDVFQQNSQPKTDVLWVIDNSGSMSDKQSYLSSNAQTFVTQANAKNGDYQMAVISTDWSKTSPSTASSSSSYPGAKIWAGQFFPTPQPNFSFSSPQVIKRSDPNPGAELAKNIKVGECCSDVAEAGIEAAKVALSNPLISDPTKPNMAFLRADAKLAIIVLSDEEEQGPVTNIQYYVDFFQQLKGAKNTSLFAWHSIVGDSPNGCSGNGIYAQAGTRYVDMAKRTGGIFRSVCATDWGRIANDIGLDAFAAKAQFILSRTADPATLVVTVNGATKTAGVDYDYDSTSNSVVFRSTSLPAAGANIKCEYDALCL